LSANQTPKRSGSTRRLVKSVEKSLRGTLRPQEDLRSCFWVQKYLSFAARFFLGELLYTLMSKPYIIAASEERVFLMKSSTLGRRPMKVLFSDDLANVSVTKGRSGISYDRLTLTHKGEEKPYELRVPRGYRGEVQALVDLLENQTPPDNSRAFSYRKFS
jgi:hypothetical protein